jgi:hypothetical protein
VIHEFSLNETHYPYAFAGQFTCSDQRLAHVIPIALRTLEMCSHETYMDCPYYEQLMYVGDTRLEVLTTYATTADDRLPRKAVLMFDFSRRSGGLTQSRYPSRITQWIPPFSLWWVAMVHDYAMWRNDLAFVAGRMAGVRTVLEAFRPLVNADHLVRAPQGWNFMDWVPGWETGMPPDGDHGVSGLLSWQLVLVLRQAAELEDLQGEAELAQRNRVLADRIAKAAGEAYWDEGRGVFADDLSRTKFSEHSQCLALLGGLQGPKRLRVAAGLCEQKDLARTTIYFSHYLFEAYRQIGRMDLLLERLGLWFSLKDNGFRTTLEAPEPSRSDCHAWGAHPVFHYFASLLGIRPASPGFASVRIEPQLGPLGWARGSMPHPAGAITMEVRRSGEALEGMVALPAGISGKLLWEGRSQQLRPGAQTLRLAE